MFVNTFFNLFLNTFQPVIDWHVNLLV